MIEAPASERPNSVLRIVADVRDELASRDRYPPGPTSFSLRRTHQLVVAPLPLLLGLYRQYGPIFTVRGLHRRAVVMLGPEANHFVTVSGADRFSWRQGSMGDLADLIGDGLLTTDGAYHDRARRIMMPAFHRERMDAQLAVMVEETDRALASWRHGIRVDVYAWVRELALRIAMRALLGLDPDDRERGHEAALQFEQGLAFFGKDAWVRPLRGPFTPWQRLRAARRELDRIVQAEIEARRRRPDPDRGDVLGMLIEARDEDGGGFTDAEIRDQLMTLLFAGHDTSSSTLSFMLYELARHPEALARVTGEQDEVLAARPPTVDQLLGDLPELEMAFDETLRLYPPAWVGPRRAVKDFEFGGHRVPAGAYVLYSSWASHRLPDVFHDPEEFIPERFAPAARRRLPVGAYVPFGGGSRICIGKRFGQLVTKTVATRVLQRFDPRPVPGHELRFHLMPTISPRGGLPMLVSERPSPRREAGRAPGRAGSAR